MSQSIDGDNSFVLNDSNHAENSTFDDAIDHLHSSKESYSISETEMKENGTGLSCQNIKTSLDFTPDTFRVSSPAPQTVTVTIAPNERICTISSSLPLQGGNANCTHISPSPLSSSVPPEPPLDISFNRRTAFGSEESTFKTIDGSQLNTNHDFQLQTKPVDATPVFALRSSSNRTSDCFINSDTLEQSPQYTEFYTASKEDSTSSHNQPTPCESVCAQAQFRPVSLSNLETDAHLTFEATSFRELQSPTRTINGVLQQGIVSCTNGIEPQQVCEFVTESSCQVDPGCINLSNQSLAATVSTNLNEPPLLSENTIVDVPLVFTTVKNENFREPYVSTVPISNHRLGSADSAFKRVSAAPVNSTDLAISVASTKSDTVGDSQSLLNSTFCTSQKPSNILVDDSISLASHLTTPNMLPNFGRFSPAQVVAATGGAPVDILRQIECGEGDGTQKDDDKDTKASAFAGSELNRDGLIISSSSRSESCSHSSTTLSPVINIQVKVDANLTPTSPDVVAASSEVIFGNFLTESYRMEVAASARASVLIEAMGANTSASATAQASYRMQPSTSREHVLPVEEDPFGPEFASIPQSAPGSMEAVVAHNLALIGDEINRTYGARLDSMIKILPVDECPLEIFSNVARVLFSRGPTNWGQVVALFCFGYRLVMRRVCRGLANAFFQVCKCLINFCSQMNVFAWIAAQGGWRIVQYLTCGRLSNATSDDLHDDEGSLSRSIINMTSLLPTSWSDSNLPPTSMLVVGLLAVCSALFVYRRLRQ